MNNYLPVENRNDLVKDASTGSVLNTDNNALSAYKKRKKKSKEDSERIKHLEDELSEIKLMLKTLLEK